MSVSKLFEPFDMKNGDWESYTERFAFFMEAHGVTDMAKQRALFFASCGSDLHSLVKSLLFPSTIATTPVADIINKLNDHFSPRPNEIVESYKFHTRNQGSEESMAAYITELRKLSRFCNFTDLERTLRDRLVCGVHDAKLQESLLKKANLTYKIAVEIALQAEKRDKDLRLIRVSAAEEQASTSGAGNGHGASEPEPMEVNKVGDDRQSKLSCYRCGGRHTYSSCRFAAARCHHCKKTGHIARMCRSKKTDSGDIKEIQAEEENLNGLHCVGGKQRVPPIFIELKVNKVPVKFEVDSGASYTIISEEQARSIWPSGIPILEKSSLNLQTWTFSRVQLLGSIQVLIEYKDFKNNLALLIAKGRGQALLGRNWFKQLGISIGGVCTVSESINNLNQEKDELFKLMEKYEEVFRSELGEYKGPEVEINCREGTQPRFMACRPVPFAIRDQVCEEIDRLVNTGVLEPVAYSEWATPIVPVKKANGSIRLCGDYRLTVNLATDVDTYPQPTINESLSQLAGGKIFTKLDLKEAFTQVRVGETTAKILTLNTPKGLYKMKRLPYGLKACPGIFQRLMATTLAGMKGVTVLIDDILLAGKDENEHQERLEEVLKRLKKVGLTLNKKKCEIATDRVEFLGFVVDRKGIHPCEKKINMIKDAKPPRNIKELQAFLGLLNFYERFIKNKATLLEPLHRLLDQGAVWQWGKEENNAFETAKMALSSKQTLTHFDNNRKITLTCDASEYAVGTVLAHVMDDGTEQPIAMGSRTLNKHERNYAQIDKEAAAIMFGLEKFYQYIYGRHITIYTDHKPLLGIFSPNKAIPKVLSPRMMRWALKLNSFSYELKHKSGVSIVNADALSRWPLEGADGSSEEEDSDILLLSDTPSAVQYTAQDIAKETDKDVVMARVKYWIQHGWPDRVEDGQLKVYWLKRKELSLSNDCIIWGSRVVIPPSMREYMLQALHETHDGIVISKSIARSYFWWPGLDHEIETRVSSCDRCQGNRNMPASTAHSWVTPTNPWQRIHVDFAGPYQGKIFFIVVDPNSKWPEVKIVRSTSSQSAITALRNIFAGQGLPEVLVSDNGTAFTSEEFKSFLQTNGIRHILTPPYSPSSNGQAERMVQTVKNKLRVLPDTDMEVKLPRLLFALRTAPSTATGKSPAEVLNKRRFRTRFDIIHPFSAKPTAERQIESNREAPVRLFRVQDQVWLRNYARGERWIKGKIVRVRGPVRFLVQIENGPVVCRHINQLRRRDSEQQPGVADAVRDQLGIPAGAVVTLGTGTLRHD